MPQIRMRPISKEDQIKLKMNPFTPVAYNKYTHQLIDSHMANHTKRITGAKSRIDTSIPKSAVRCIKSRDRFKLPAKNELTGASVELENFQLPQTYFEGKDLSEFFKLEHCHSNRSLSKTRLTKTGKQAISRKTTTTTTTIPWRHTSKTECLGKTTNFPSLVTSVCATQLATKHMQRNVKYRHVKSKIRQLYFDTEKMNEKHLEIQKNETGTESEYSSDPDHDDSELSGEDLTLSDMATNTALKNVSLNETYNLSEIQLDKQTGTKDITNGTNICETDVIEATDETTEFKPPDTSELELEPTEMVSLPNQDKLTPTQELEYLKLKRAITQECVKYNIFTPGGVKKLCERKTKDRSDLEEERVSELIGQILRELDY